MLTVLISHTYDTNHLFNSSHLSTKQQHYFWECFQVRTFFLEIAAFLGQKKLRYSGAISSDDPLFLFLEITLNLGRKLVLSTIILELKIRISHRIFFLPEIYCMSYSLTTHEIPNFMIRFWHLNCMISLRGHRMPLIC